MKTLVDGILTFLGMGGYAAFVWPALILTTVVLVTMLALSLQDLRRAEQALRRLEPAGRARSRRNRPT